MEAVARRWHLYVVHAILRTSMSMWARITKSVFRKLFLAGLIRKPLLTRISKMLYHERQMLDGIFYEAIDAQA